MTARVQKGSQNESPSVTIKHAMTLLVGQVNSIMLKQVDVIFVIGKLTKCILKNATSSTGLIPRWNVTVTNKRREMMGNAILNNLKSAMVAMVGLSMAFAEGMPKLDIRIDDQKINMTQEESLTPAIVSYYPGDTLRYVITASNVGDGLMTEPSIVDPIPEGVTYIPNTATGKDAEISFSINEGNTYMSWPPYYTVRNSKGILIKRKATADMISHIKWNISRGLRPSERSDLEFLVVVDG